MDEISKNYSYELIDVLTYMKDILYNEFPTDLFTSEYLIVSILDTKKCHANLMLDNFLMTDNINEIRNVYASLLNDNKKHVLIDKANVVYAPDLNELLHHAEIEAEKTNVKQVGTEHVLLSILNPEYNNKNRVVFNTAGVSYDFIFDRCKVESPSKRAKKKNVANGNIPDNNIKGPQFVMLKSDMINGMAVGNSEYIKRYTTNINEAILNNSVDAVIGRESEIQQIIRVFARRKKNNVILIGNGGVGKTSIVYEVARRIEIGEVPPILEGKVILSLDMMAIVSGTNFRGMFEERVKGILDELKKSNKYILFIDDIHNSLKSSHKDKDSDISGMISDILSDGNVRVIGTTSPKEYRATIESNPAMSHKFQSIMINPTSKEDTIHILMENKRYYEEYHNVEYDEDAIKKCVELAERYITTRCLPDSAIDAMDLAGAYVSLSSNKSEEYSALTKRLSDIEKRKDEILNHGDFEKIDGITFEENDVKRMIADVKRRMSTSPKAHVTQADMCNTIAEITSIPISKLTDSEKQRVAKLDEILKKDIIGQDEAIESLCKVIKRNRVGLGNKAHCLGSFLALGGSGVGKTLIAKKLAENIFGDENALIRIDMSEYSEKNSVSKLHGTSQGYIGYDDGGVLTNAIKSKPYSVVLLDEIEKADESIYNIFLQVFDEGRLTESNGNVVDCKNCIFIMTSNVGARRSADLGGGIGFTSNADDNKKAIVNKELKKKFAPEFLNRLDDIIYFNTLTDDNLKSIVKLELNKLTKKIEEIKYHIDYDDKLIDYIHQEAIKQKEYGARPIIRLIQTNIEDKLTDLILENDYPQGYRFNATYDGENVTIS